MTLRSRRWFAWLALAAMAALVLPPAVMQAMAHASGSYAEICTPEGARLVALADDEGPADGPSLHLEVCPFCSNSFGALSLPPAAPALLPPPPRSSAVPALFLHAPRTLFAWRSAQPRGPPALT